MIKKISLTLLSVLLSILYSIGQVIQTVNVTQPGGLATAIGSNLKTVTDLTLIGTINATDFTTIKQMSALKNLNLSKATVDNNTIPASAFQNRALVSLVLPEGITTIQ